MDFSGKTSKEMAALILELPLIDAFINPPEQIERDLLTCGISLADMDARSRQALGLTIAAIGMEVSNSEFVMVLRAFSVGWYVGRGTAGSSSTQTIEDLIL